VDWINLAQDTDRWRALVNTALNLRVSQKAGNLKTNREILASQKYPTP
jgi:hypothetical protein